MEEIYRADYLLRVAIFTCRLVLTLLAVSAISNMSIIALTLQHRRYFVNSAMTFTCAGCVGEYTSKQFGLIAILFKTVYKNYLKTKNKNFQILR